MTGPAAMGLALALASSSAVDPAPALYEDVGTALGLTGITTSPITPSWVDLDGDGRPDPVWLSYQGAVTVRMTPDGPALQDVQLPLTLAQSQGPLLMGAVLDADDDGTPDVLAIGYDLQLLRTTGGNKLAYDPVPLPAMPGAKHNDVAVADLNADGLPDLVLALGIFSVERLDLRGFPDQILLNLGHGRFSFQTLEPRRSGFSNGITLADMDGDGLADVIESIDASPLVGPSRVLLNRTPPGATTLVFEESGWDFDPGTYGMGAAVDDLDQDGLVDIYNTSVGLDVLALGKEGGGFWDATFDRGFRHEWGNGTLRSQWSPVFLDANLDGRLDLVVREGGFGAELGLSTSGAPGTASVADLLYVQREDGTFLRLDPPFDPDAPDQGRQAVVGDLDGDGRPDVALGGYQGGAALWRNVTPTPDGTRVLTVRLVPTLSAWPATGARFAVTCDSTTLTRMVTSGGHMGGGCSSDLFVALPHCDGEASVEVTWPSGARSVHLAETDLVVATEPVWWTVAQDQVSLDPAAGGAMEACVGPVAGPWTCCAAEDAPCQLPLPANPEPPQVVRLDDRRPVALTDRGSRWELLTVPSPPRPGEDVNVHLLHVGDPAAWQPSEVSLFVDGSYQAFTHQDDGRQMLTVATAVAQGATSLPLTLFPFDVAPTTTWDPPTTAGLDPQWLELDVYPWRVTGGITEFWHWALYTNLVRDPLPYDLVEKVGVTGSDGQPMEATKQLMSSSVARMRILVDWALLDGVDSLTLLDEAGATTRTVPVTGTVTLEEATALLAEVRGGVAKNRLVEDGDMSPVFLTLRDGEGRVLPPEPDLVTLEVDGGYVSTEPLVFGQSYNLSAFITTDPGVGPGQVRVRALDGRLLGSFPFDRRARGSSGVLMDASFAALRSDLLLGAPPVTHEVVIHPFDGHGELVGASVLVELDLTGAALHTAPGVTMEGHMVAGLVAHEAATELVVDVHLDGDYLTTLTAALEPVEESPEAAPDESAADGGSTDGDSGLAESGDPPSPPPGCGGCHGARPDPAHLLWPLLAARVLARRRRHGGRSCP